MSTNSKIEWTDTTWNPLLGCTKVSAGCDNCYAVMTSRIRESNPNPKIATAYAGIVERTDAGLDWTGQINLLPERLEQPFHWRKPRRVFVNSQSDLFHDQVPDEYLVKVFDVMQNAPRHTFQILTKRHARMRSFVTRYLSGGFAKVPLDEAPLVHTVDNPPRNIWLGVSVEDQKWADIRIPELLMTPAAVRFLSMEPLLGPVDLTAIAWTKGGGTHLDVINGKHGVPGVWQADAKRIDWVIVGGESGPGARPMHPDWARRLRNQCDFAGVAFHFKQYGEWSPTYPAHLDSFSGAFNEEMGLWRVGKHAAGRELDGRTHDAYPVPATA